MGTAPRILFSPDNTLIKFSTVDCYMYIFQIPHQPTSPLAVIAFIIRASEVHQLAEAQLEQVRCMYATAGNIKTLYTIKYPKIRHGVHFTTVAQSFSQMPFSSCMEGAFEGHTHVCLDMSTSFLFTHCPFLHPPLFFRCLSHYSPPLSCFFSSPPLGELLDSSGGLLQHISPNQSGVVQLLSPQWSQISRTPVMFGLENLACFLASCKHSKLVIHQVEQSHCLPRTFVFLSLWAATLLFLLFIVGLITADSAESVLHLPNSRPWAFLIPSNQASNGHA